MINNFMLDNMNKKVKSDGIYFMAGIDDESIDACIFDPQYRAGLDMLKFGNEGKDRMKKRSALNQMSNETIVGFLSQIQRCLKPSSYMFLWVDKFTVAEGIHLNWFNEENNLRNLKLVDMIVWDKQSFGMGARSRRTNEFIMVYQKLPKTTKNWTDKGIKDTFAERIDSPRSGHPHKKPLVLTHRLITSVTNVGDIVLDPCAGSFSTLKVCDGIQRKFLGCDLTLEYADERL